MSDSNEEKYQLEDYKWIQFQILWTNIIRNVWQIPRRTADEILGVKGSRLTMCVDIFANLFFQDVRQVMVPKPQIIGG